MAGIDELTAKNMRLHYTEQGKGDKTLVFLHYFGGASSTWDEVISYLQNDFRCIAIDLLGFGKSPSQEAEISVDNSANAVIELIDELQLQNYELVGHSMGAKIALYIASSQPKGLLSLVLLAPSPPTPEPMSNKEREDMLDAFGDKKKVEKMIENATAHPLATSIFEREVNNNLQASSVGWHSWPLLGSTETIIDKMADIHMPITILYGENDKRFSRSFLQKEFNRYFKTFILVEIKDSGHLLPVEAPEEVTIEIRKSV